MPFTTLTALQLDVLKPVTAGNASLPHANSWRQGLCWLVETTSLRLMLEQSHRGMPATQNSLLLCHNWGSRKEACTLSGHPAPRLLLWGSPVHGLA